MGRKSAKSHDSKTPRRYWTIRIVFRRRLRTTNGLERLNEEIRRRERVIRIFPNRESVYRLVGAVLIEIDEKWMSGRKYLDMAEYWRWRKMKEQEARSVYQEASEMKRVG